MVFTTVASFEPEKNHELIIRSAHYLEETYHAVILFAGSGPHLEYCKAQNDQLGNTNVIFLGRRSDVTDILHASDVFLYPCNSEGMPNALMEAMMVGLPCVVSDIPQNTFLIRDGENGVAFVRGNADSLKASLLRLFARPENLSVFGSRAKKTIETEFTVASFGNRHVSVFEAVTKSSVSLKND